MSVLLETTLGDIVIDLFTDERPRASLNFLKLCKIKYYNFCLFHFVQRNFTAQTGDPTGTGKGGESVFRYLYGEQAKFFEAEVKPRLKHINKGTVSMVNNGDNMHGSQFFFTLADNLDYLDGIHTVFGEVSEGMEILEKINEAICDDTNRPYQDIRISHTVILDDPFDDPPELVIPDRSPEPTKEQLESSRIGADEKIDDTEGKTTEEIEEMIADKEEKAGAQVLEMIGDIPDADIKPPENVLFVCKLNPVTTDEDLEIIFSRFGTITSCEIVRDQKSGESLQYAFIEFEKEEDCERAYFKMDNVLIDDRRIHVDFSQSVAHIKWTKQGAKPVYAEKKESQPKYAIKEKARKDKYDLVFDESESSDEEKRKKEKSEKKDKEKRRKQDRKREHKDKSRQDSSSEDDSRKRRHKERRKEDRHDQESYDKRRYHHDDSDDRRRREGDKEGSYRRREDEKRRERSRNESYHRHSSGEKRPSSSQEHDRRYRERDSEKSRHRHR